MRDIQWASVIPGSSTGYQQNWKYDNHNEEHFYGNADANETCQHVRNSGKSRWSGCWEWNGDALVSVRLQLGVLCLVAWDKSSVSSRVEASKSKIKD